MTIQNERQFKNTQQKLSEAEKLYEETKGETQEEDQQVRELTLRSLKQTINELKEQLARYRAHSRVATP